MDAEFVLSLAVLAGFAACAMRISAWLNRIADGGDMLIVRRAAKASPEDVWSCVINDRHIPVLPGLTIRRYDLGDGGNRVATVLEDEDGWVYRTVDRVTRLEPGRQLVRHVEEVDGRKEPFGAGQWETVALNPTANGTEILLATQGQFGLANVLWLIVSLNVTARRICQAAEAA